MSRDGGKEGRDALHVRDLLGHDQPVVPDQRLARRPHAVLPVERQRNVGPRRVPPVEGPLRLAVADDEDAGRVWHFLVVLFLLLPV